MSEVEKWQIKTRREQPELAERFYVQKKRIWAEFMLHDVVSNKLWHRADSDRS